MSAAVALEIARRRVVRLQAAYYRRQRWRAREAALLQGWLGLVALQVAFALALMAGLTISHLPTF